MNIESTAPLKPAGWRMPALVRDVLLIVLGAGLALAAEEWRDSRATRHRTDVALAGIRAEMRANLTRVEAAERHHKAVVDTLNAYVARKETPSDALLFSGVFNPAHVLSTAWQTARDTRALAELPYPVLLRLGTIYEQQQQYTDVGNALEQTLTSGIWTEGVKTAFLDRWKNLIFLNRDFGGRADGLATRYRHTLAYLDSLPELRR